jgi:hypothetical protein
MLILNPFFYACQRIGNKRGRNTNVIQPTAS